MPPYSPRSGTQKVVETGAILTIFALAIPAGLQALRDFAGAPISPDLEVKVTACLMAKAGVLLEAAQHWWVYKRRGR
jgi:hypothetical protein